MSLIVLVLANLACTGISYEKSNPLKSLSSLLRIWEPPAGWKMSAAACRGCDLTVSRTRHNIVGLHAVVSQRAGMQPTLLEGGDGDERRRFIISALTAAATSWLPDTANAKEATLQQAEQPKFEVLDMYKSLLPRDPDSKNILQIEEIGRDNRTSPPDYLQRNIALPTQDRIVSILQPYNALMECSVSTCMEPKDLSGTRVSDAGFDLCRGASTGSLRMSTDDKFKPVTITGKRVLELGSGTGVAGIGAAVGGASSVVMTDTSLELLVLAKRNAALNNISVTTSRLRWGNAQDEASVFGTGPFDIVMASEVGYKDSVLADLFGTMRRCMVAAKKAGVGEPLAVLHVTSYDSDDDFDFPFRQRKDFLKAASKIGLKYLQVIEVETENTETERLLFKLA